MFSITFRKDKILYTIKESEELTHVNVSVRKNINNKYKEMNNDYKVTHPHSGSSLPFLIKL